jgi:hypothetical protein
MTSWDAQRFADKVKNSQVNEDGTLSKLDMKLWEYFPKASFGPVSHPATVQDQFQRIIVWYLPDIIHHLRIVSD